MNWRSFRSPCLTPTVQRPHKYTPNKSVFWKCNALRPQIDDLPTFFKDSRQIFHWKKFISTSKTNWFHQHKIGSLWLQTLIPLVWCCLSITPTSLSNNSPTHSCVPTQSFNRAGTGRGWGRRTCGIGRGALHLRLRLSFQKTEFRGFPGGAVVENLPANAGNTGSSPALGGSHMPRSN